MLREIQNDDDKLDRVETEGYSSMEIPEPKSEAEAEDKEEK